MLIFTSDQTLQPLQASLHLTGCGLMLTTDLGSTGNNFRFLTNPWIRWNCSEKKNVWESNIVWACTCKLQCPEKWSIFASLQLTALHVYFVKLIMQMRVDASSHYTNVQKECNCFFNAFSNSDTELNFLNMALCLSWFTGFTGQGQKQQLSGAGTHEWCSTIWPVSRSGSTGWTFLHDPDAGGAKSSTE